MDGWGRESKKLFGMALLRWCLIAGLEVSLISILGRSPTKLEGDCPAMTIAVLLGC